MDLQQEEMESPTLVVVVVVDHFNLMLDLVDPASSSCAIRMFTPSRILAAV
jgi:hypothetical protein